ncbi:hypothetical protein B1756_11555 [Natrarchaeobaculum aegyptiacum]|uniref:DUF1102 domain-containing protein n=2 Tax=Natrarchaeobaculum aegyptiacum TaxID=745377 RepID=A0A2Z2I3E4_9EURY|nr:hypothetical protein B1756_11555 [Natrarchaeobaculum aegyptiacum]
MQRRNFLLGVGSTAIGTSALVGSGAFSRVESQRDVKIAVAEDKDAYLGLKPCDTKHGDNFVGDDGRGHVTLDFGASGNDGDGVNSDSRTWFDNVLKICNQGKADANVYVSSDALEDAANFPKGVSSHYKDPTDVDDEFLDEWGNEWRLAFYTGEAAGSSGDENLRSIVGQANEFELPVGECECIGVRVVTKDVDAEKAEHLFDGTITITADSPEAGSRDGKHD